MARSDDPRDPTRRSFIERAGVLLGTFTLGCAGVRATGETLADGDDSNAGTGTGGTGAPETGTGGGTSTSGSSDDATGAGTRATTFEEGTGESTGATNTTGPDDCVPTSPNIEGPFYIEGVPVRTDLDLYGDEGIKFAVSGVVRGSDCAPLAGAVVEIWQCDPEGDYDNDSPEMRYRGQMVTDARGGYAFTTLVPGRYPNAGTFRPAHIHVKVWVNRVQRLTTQLYFEGDPFNEDDPWIEDDLIMATHDDGAGGLVAEIDLVLNP
jgi:protocatechuate 3,4-dioxygenase beta subunit